ncbi:MAG: hypothetical protein DWQ37_03045 [Planctomycetota bacterium]|nr:MAG: hypothetical protein DWQ37_03045 [Planctomycetota bacterium]
MSSHPESLHQPPTGSSEERTVTQRVGEGKRYLEERVAENPTSVMLLSFVLGAGVGTVLGMTLLDQGSNRRRKTADGFLAHVSDTVTRAIHDSIPDKFFRS